MIKSISVTNYLGESLFLELTRPENSGFVISEIKGIGPAKANINISDLSSMDGAIYNSARKESRNITMKLVYYPTAGISVEQLRLKSYKYFPVKKKVKFEITTDSKTVYTEGYVEANEVDIFSKQEASHISIICPDPFFYAMKETNSGTFSGSTNLFEFKLDSEFEFEVSELKRYVETTFQYEGDEEVGVTLNILTSGIVGDITIVNGSNNERMVFNNEKLKNMTGEGLKKGDNLIICTEKGHKSARLIRNGVSTNVINCITTNSTWISIVKGANNFIITSDVGKQFIEATIKCKTAYEGI